MSSGLCLIPLRMNLLILPVCAVLLAVSAPAWANLSRDAAAAAAQRVNSGRVLSVEMSENHSRPAWRVKVLTAQGEVGVILIDPAGGQPLHR